MKILNHCESIFYKRINPSKMLDINQSPNQIFVYNPLPQNVILNNTYAKFMKEGCRTDAYYHLYLKTRDVNHLYIAAVYCSIASHTLNGLWKQKGWQQPSQ